MLLSFFIMSDSGSFDICDYSLKRLKEKGHIVILENDGYGICIYNYGCRDRVLNYFVLGLHGEKFTIEDLKKKLGIKN